MKKYASKIISVLCAILCIIIVLYSIIFSFSFSYAEGSETQLQVITIWQIDSFEGGRGSRSDYIRSCGTDFAKEYNVYIEVTSVTADAARINLQNGVTPDIISYGAGTYGIESYINENYGVSVWCRGGYCLLSLESDDFSAADGSNTVINAGKDNLVSAAALLCGLQDAKLAQPTSAYVELINGEYRYLLGTQRDIVRLQTRDVNFYVSPITLFNDLYQCISVLADGEKGIICSKFIEYLISCADNLVEISMLCDGYKLYDGILGCMEGVEFEYTIPYVVSAEWRKKVITAINENNKDKLKSLLK